MYQLIQVNYKLTWGGGTYQFKKKTYFLLSWNKDRLDITDDINLSFLCIPK